MTLSDTKTERLEVFCYTWPSWYLVLSYVFVVAATLAIMIVIVGDFREWLASWAFPLAITAGMYALGFIGISRGLKMNDRLKQPCSDPSMVVDLAGLTTKWSVRIPWSDIRDFAVGRAKSLSGPTMDYPCVLVSNIGDYQRPWYVSRFFGSWEPDNALPILPFSIVGHFVSCDDLGIQKRLSGQDLIDELRNFRGRIHSRALRG